MKFTSRSLSAGIIVVMSCLVWTGAISVTTAYFFKLPASGGWMIAGVLSIVAATAATFILYGMRHASDLTDHDDPLIANFSDLPANPRESLDEVQSAAPRLK